MQQIWNARRKAEQHRARYFLIGLSSFFLFIYIGSPLPRNALAASPEPSDTARSFRRPEKIFQDSQEDPDKDQTERMALEASQLLPQNTLMDFLSDSSPLSTSSKEPGEAPSHETGIQVAPIMEKQCTSTGDSESGSSACLIQYASHTITQIESEHSMEGNELKRQTILTTLDSSGKQLNRQSIRQKTVFDFVGNRKVKKADYLDIVDRPSQGPITREFLVYEYDLHSDSDKILKRVWVHYQQIAATDFAEILYHVMLAYDPNGKPYTGYAETWKNQKIKKVVFAWDQDTHAFSRQERTHWSTLEKEITQLFRQWTNF